MVAWHAKVGAQWVPVTGRSNGECCDRILREFPDCRTARDCFGDVLVKIGGEFLYVK